MLESFVNFVDVSHEYFHLLCKSRAGGDAAGAHRRHRQPNETLVRASRSFIPLLFGQKPHRSEAQYKCQWTRNYALIFSYRSPVATVPIGLSGVCPGVKPRHASISSLGLDPTSKSLESGPGVQNLIECYNCFVIGHWICRWGGAGGLKLELKIRS